MSDGEDSKAKQLALSERTADLFGKTWNLRFSNRALFALRDAWGYQSDGLVVMRITRMNPSDLPYLFYALTRSNHRLELSLEACVEMFDEPRKFEEWKPTSDLFAEICGAALPAPKTKPGAGKNPPPPAGKKTPNPPP